MTNQGKGSNDAAPSVKDLVLEAGLELLDRDGLKLTFASIGYTKVFEHLEVNYGIRVTRASVHERIWASQDDFRLDVLAHAVGFLPQADPAHVVVGEWGDVAGDTDDFARHVGAVRYGEVLASSSFRQFQSAKALASRIDDPTAAESVRQLFTQRTEEGLAQGRAKFPAILAGLRLRPKPELGLTVVEAGELLHLLMVMLFDGAHLNYHAGSHDVAEPIDFGSLPAGAAEPWSVLSVGIKAFLDFLFEADPNPPDPVAVDGPLARSLADHPAVDPTLGRPGSSRRTRQELKQLVLSAGVELLLQGDLELKAELLGYTAVFAHIKETRGVVVNRSSIHNRFWASNEAFHLDVVTAALLRTDDPDPAVTRVLATAPPVSHEDGSLHRRQTAFDAIRTLGHAMAGLSQSLITQRLLQVKAALLDQAPSPATTTLRNAIRQTDQRRMDRNRAPVQDNILDLGFEPRPELGLTEERALTLICQLVLTTNTGALFDRLAGIEAVNRSYRLPRCDGEAADANDWNPIGIAIRAYFELLYQESAG